VLICRTLSVLARAQIAQCQTAVVVAAVHYFATKADQLDLLDYLGEPQQVSLHPWPVMGSPRQVLSREEAIAHSQVTIVHAELGPPIGRGPNSPAMNAKTKAGVFNRMNRERLRLRSHELLVDANASPVLLWQPAVLDDSVLRVSVLGSQADSTSAISVDYERWVNRVMGWVRRKGTKVWGLEAGDTRPDLDIDLPHISTVYALPAAVAGLGQGVPGR